MLQETFATVSQITLFLMLVTEADGGLLLLCGPVQPVFSELVPNDPPE